MTNITANSEEEREILNLKRHFYIFVFTLAGVTQNFVITNQQATKSNQLCCRQTT